MVVPVVVAIALMACGDTPTTTRETVARIEWPAYGGDAASLRWSTADEITPLNVANLQRAWTWRTGEIGVEDRGTGARLEPGKFEATPLMVGDTLYLSTPYNRVVALDARTGREFWSFDPGATRWGPIGYDHAKFVHRGVALWTGDGSRRVLIASRWQLIALDAATGVPVGGFGDRGRVDLSLDLRWPVNRMHFGSTSPPVVFGDIVIVGSAIADRLIHERDPPGDVQAFDARTGKRIWRWDPVPGVGDPARASWGGASADVTGHANVWAPFSVDTERGLVFLPVSAASNDWYGGARPGDNRYSESVVCLDARTGRLIWHQQLVHHGLWDYDPAGPPALVTMRRAGADLPAVVLAGKTGFLYAFDRTTGEPLWPMPERPVGASDVPGEVPSPTQPIPEWPVPFARQGFSRDDVVDFTPAIRQQALALIASFRVGPMFTPPSVVGTIVMPGWIGGAGWGATAIDPERRMIFVKATNLPVLAKLVERDSVTRFELNPKHGPSTPLNLELRSWRSWYGRSRAGTSIPISKPPYGTLTAIDLDSGERRWQITLGDRPVVRTHPDLRKLKLPPLGVPGAPGGVATRGGLVFITGGGSTLYAIDARDGAMRWSVPLGTVGYSNPMTYRASDGRQYVVVATGEGRGAMLQAFVLPTH